MLLPVLMDQFGPKQAVSVADIAALMANVGKLMAWWHEMDWRAFAAYSVPGVPAAALGAWTLVLPPHLVDAALGAFFLAMTRRPNPLDPPNFEHSGPKGGAAWVTA